MIINAISQSLQNDGVKVEIKGVKHSAIEIDAPITYKGLEELLQTDEAGVVTDALSTFIIAVQNCGRNAQKALILKKIKEEALSIVDGIVDVADMADELIAEGVSAMSSYIAGERRRTPAKFGLKAAKVKFFDLAEDKQIEAHAVLKDEGEEAFVEFVKAA